MNKKEFIIENGIKIPAVGYGSYLSTEKNGKSVIKDALDAGYRYIDTARMYGNESETYRDNPSSDRKESPQRIP